MRPHWWTLFNLTGILRRYRHRYTQRDVHTGAQGEDGHLQAKIPRGTSPDNTLISDFQTLGVYISVI